MTPPPPETESLRSQFNNQFGCKELSLPPWVYIPPPNFLPSVFARSFPPRDSEAMLMQVGEEEPNRSWVVTCPSVLSDRLQCSAKQQGTNGY